MVKVSPHYCVSCTFIWAGGDQSTGPVFVSKYIRILIKGLYQEALSRRGGADLRAGSAAQGLAVAGLTTK